MVSSVSHTNHRKEGEGEGGRSYGEGESCDMVKLESPLELVYMII